MELQTSLLIAALVITVLGVGAYALLLHERIKGLEEQRKTLRGEVGKPTEKRGEGGRAQ